MSKYFNRLPLWLCVLVALSVGVLSSSVTAAPAAQPAATGSAVRLIGGRRMGRRRIVSATTTGNF